MRIFVGAEGKEFLVPKDLLVARTDFFKAACSQQWLTDGSKPIRLPEDKPAVFCLYLRFLYTGGDLGLDDDNDEDDEGSQETEETLSTEMKMLMRFYVLVDKLGDRAAIRSVIDELVG